MRQKPRRPPRLLFLALPALCFLGCVGPTTPLGAVDHPGRGYHPVPAPASAPAEATATAQLPPFPRPEPPPPSAGAEIRFSPGYQQVHGPYTWRVEIRDPGDTGGEGSARVRVFYDDLEVSDSAASQFRVQRRAGGAGDPAALLLEMPHLRLDPLREHRIRVEYRTTAGEPLTARYPFPSLSDLGFREPLGTTEPFDVDPALRDAIDRAGSEFGVNPAVLAALIAQESSFDPRALSRARALGLTQVTQLTEPDIARHFSGWPRNPSLGRFSRGQLRSLIPAVINGTNEWRLDPEKSIRGGAFYLGHLRDRLRAEVNRPYLERAGPDRGRTVVEASLAAYNSGLNRILSMMKTHGPRWLEQRPTREAKRYVRKILSYYGSFRGDAAAPSPPGDAT